MFSPFLPGGATAEVRRVEEVAEEEEVTAVYGEGDVDMREGRVTLLAAPHQVVRTPGGRHSARHLQVTK